MLEQIVRANEGSELETDRASLVDNELEGINYGHCLISLAG